MSNPTPTQRISYTIVCLVLALEVWAVAKYVSIPVALGLMTYLLKPNLGEKKENDEQA